MDPLSHTLLGVTMARAGLQRTHGAGTTTTLVVASWLPDVDILWIFAGTATATLERHTWSHSIFGLPLLCLVAATVVRCRYRHMRFPVLFGLCLLGASAHVLLDVLNSYGVALLAPFWLHRVEWGVAFVADPLFIACLAVPLLITVVWQSADAQVVSRLGLCLAVAYVGFCTLNRGLAAQHLADYIQRSGVTASSVTVVPEPLGPHRWSGLIRSGDTYHVVLIHSLSGHVQASATVQTMEHDPRIAAALYMPLARQLRHFLKAPVWSIDGDTVVVSDLRFRSQVLGNDWDPFRFRLIRKGATLVRHDWSMPEVRARLLQTLRQVGQTAVSRPSHKGEQH